LLKHLEEENLLSGMFDPKESENNTESKSSSILQFSQDGLLKQGRGSTPLLSRKSENSDEQSDSPDTNLVDVGAFQVDLEALNAKVDWACIEALIEHVNFIHDGFFEIVDDNPIELIADEEDVIQEVTFQETSAQPMSIS